MDKLNASPERNSFAINNARRRAEEKGEDPDQNDFIEFLKSEKELKREREQDPKWQENNMEYDLRSAKWICDKTKASESYAQNLYAAMCNRQFQRRDTWPILKDERWSCSWRYAGGIVADMLEKGDYIDWYCSGIRDIGVYAPDREDEELTEEQKERKAIVDKFVPESVVTEEIEQDLNRLGWIVIDQEDDNR
jgi:hypothetical protein